MPAANPKKNVTEDDEDSHDNEEQDNQENEQEMIKKAYTKEMFVKHFKSTLGPQDDDEEPHPSIANSYHRNNEYATSNGKTSMAIARSLSCHDTSRFCLQLICRMTME